MQIRNGLARLFLPGVATPAVTTRWRQHSPTMRTATIPTAFLGYRVMKTRIAAVAVALLVASLAGPADAAFVIDVYQSGSNVVATGSGSLDLTDLNLGGSAVDSSSAVRPDFGIISVGPTGSGLVDEYTGISYSGGVFGTGGSTLPSSGTGDLVGIKVHGGVLLAVPAGYVSGTSLSDSSTYDNTTIAGLGMTPGTYTFTWGSSPDADSLTVNIGVASVPEPSSLVLAGTAALAGLAAWARRRRAPR
jgi:hypothetical protein